MRQRASMLPVKPARIARRGRQLNMSARFFVAGAGNFSATGERHKMGTPSAAIAGTVRTYTRQ